MELNWQNLVVIFIVGLAGLWLGRALVRAAKAFLKSGKSAGCPPGCSCGKRERD
ncbi:MAG: hypothetical protein ABSE73_25705 [Planctomycetota bacterium]